MTIIMSSYEFFQTNAGDSISHGSVRNGSVENAYLADWSGTNYSYFSFISYFLADNAYLHSDIYKIVKQAYKTCEITCPGIHFKLMECGNTKGGKMYFHRTHQNGLGIDFMIPNKKNGNVFRWFDHLGMLHYLLEYDKDGRNNIFSSVHLDFETMAKHILALDDAAKANGFRIHKAILKVELLDDFFATPSGRKVKERGIYFMPRLYPLANKVHDDHYHIDFERAR